MLYFCIIITGGKKVSLSLNLKYKNTVNTVSMKFSYFTSVWSTKPERSISAAEVAEIIASSELQVRTEAYRRYISKEMTKDAENMKKSMPG